MKRLITALLCLALALSASASWLLNPYRFGAAAPSVPGLPGLKDVRFYWDAQTLNADYLGGSVPPVYQLAGIPDAVGLPTLGTNPYDSQTWGVIGGAWDKWDWWVDTDEPTVWGSTSGKQWVRLRYMVETAFTADMLLFQVNAKTRDAGSPLNGNAGIRLDTTTSSSSPAIVGTNVTVVVPNSASVPAGTELELVVRYNKVTSNAGGAITEALYIRRSGYATASGYSTATFASPDQPYYHNMQPGNDRITAGAYYLRGFFFGRDYDHDMPVRAWQDFNFSTLDATNLQANDHNDSLTWVGTGTTSRFSLVSGAPAMPSTVNLYDASVGKILRNDLTATASGAWGFTFTNSSALFAHGMWVRINTGLASGTSARVAYVTSDTNQTSETASLIARNTAGQHEFYLAGATNSGVINISPNTWYWVTFTSRQNATQTLWVYDSNGTQLSGSGTTCTGGARGTGSLRVGSTGSYTAQASGVSIDVAHLCYNSNATAILQPWAVSP